MCVAPRNAPCGPLHLQTTGFMHHLLIVPGLQRPVIGDKEATGERLATLAPGALALAALAAVGRLERAEDVERFARGVHRTRYG
jgi:hypothetical protein